MLRSVLVATATRGMRHTTSGRGACLNGCSQLEHQLSLLSLSSSASSSIQEKQLLPGQWRAFSTKPATADEKEEEAQPFPANLKVDPRSSFAPVSRREQAAIALEEEDDDDNLGDADEIQTIQEGEQVAKVDASSSAEAADKDDYESEDYDDEDDDFFYEPETPTYVTPLPERLHVPIYNFSAADTNNSDNNEGPEEVGTIWLHEDVFGRDPIRIDLLKRAVDYHRAKKRGRRKAHTKRIGDIRGSTRKMRPQKGQGAARAGHKKVGHWRGGAKAHGPTNQTDYGNTKLNKKVRRLAVKNVLSQKLKENNLILVNQFHNLPTHKTKVLAQWLSTFGIGGRHGTSALLIDHYYNDESNEEEESAAATSYQGVPINLNVASGNLKTVSTGNQLRNLNVYNVLRHEKLVLTLDAVAAIEARLQD